MSNQLAGISIVGLLLAGLLLSFTVERTPEPTGVISFDLSIADDATPHVLAEFRRNRSEGISRMEFAKGTYHFYPEKGAEFFSYISNHKDVQVWTAFPIIDLQNLVIDGGGATFIFHGRMIPFLLEESSDITLKNVTVDWAEPFHSEALVVANDQNQNTFDLRIGEEYPYEIRNGELIFLKEYYEHPLGQTILFDPETRGVAYNTEAYTPLTTAKRLNGRGLPDARKYPLDALPGELLVRGTERRLRAEELSPGLIRIHGHNKLLPEPGLILTAKGYPWDNRIAPAIRIFHCQDFLAENVTIHHAGGMGLIAENSTDLTLDNYEVSPSNGRMVSTSADATHFVGCRGTVTIKNSRFFNQLDDATNVHGTYQVVEDILSTHSLGMRVGHHQQQGSQLGYPGERIGAVDLDSSFFSYAEMTIESVEKVNSRYSILTFREPLPTALARGHLLENLDAYPELVVKNCTISGNRARGLLLSTPRKIVIDSNYFHTEMEAILVPVESGKWYEAGSVTDLTVTNNTFDNCNYGGRNRGVIRFIPDDENENIAFLNVNVSDNEFRHFDNLFLEVNNVNGFRFAGNTIIDSGSFPALYPGEPAIRVRASRNLEFRNNDYRGRARVILDADNNDTELTFE
ncbi:hypothetical protein GGR26_001161 [Lewinella marina]|uniref:Alpha-galactosidase n=1 Tax=Neolewinella marina TaxID=438751 RepID=A0A2G0CFZ8_9BACT|nr:right-handed parallel beta-helix repeat-containing protein [Neolewinella marina]NJB85416.1 hypothetical protein [Neolewinella marina]PHK98892.1 alpha-galactosidase [Neolewinella marina]